MIHTSVLVHALWTTKDKKPLITKSKKEELCGHIRKFASAENIQLVNVNGWQEHLHALLFIQPDQSIDVLINLIKTESSFWANKKLKWTEKFEWESTYSVVSISRSQLEIVNVYINEQEEHHRKKTFEQEYNDYMNNYLFEKAQ
jgi:putative transposase